MVSPQNPVSGQAAQSESPSGYKYSLYCCSVQGIMVGKPLTELSNNCNITSDDICLFTGDATTMAIIDNLSKDGGRVKLYHLSKLTEFPDFVKTAEVIDVDISHIPDTSFADDLFRRFPVHTKSATWLSHGYFILEKDKLEKGAATRIKNRLDHFSKYWDIEEAVDTLYNPPAEKVAGTDTDYALKVSHNDGVNHYFPINSIKSLTKSAADLIEHRKNFTYEMRKQAAENILRRAHEFKLSPDFLPDKLRYMAGIGMSTKQAVDAELDNRFYSKQPQHKEAADKLMGFKDIIKNEASGYVRRDILEKVAQALDVYDRFTDMHTKYGASIAFPEDILFSHIKAASEDEIVKLTTGSEYTLKTLVKAGTAFSVLGDIKDSLIDALGKLDMQKVADIVPTLPKGDAAALDEALKTIGVSKVIKTVKTAKASRKPIVDSQYENNKAGKMRRARVNRARNIDGKYLRSSKPKSSSKLY